MQPRQNSKKQNLPPERSLKRVLADSGYSDDVADKIWKWYNPTELKSNKVEKQ
jgi:hypothetical protein